ncbi:heterokaryon incompatibility protein-domain-containing protein [Paraphoma chrysanthemicola]|nr:heterokaryon incompatibility protein-domain-containing protein [Paraphoma chrysanthemicola]
MDGPNYVDLVMEDFKSPSGPCGKILGGDTGDDGAFGFLARQYKICQETHVKCQKATNSPYLPSRVIDVGIDGDSQVALRTSKELDASHPYLTLSHCWGGSQPLKLTVDTVSRLKCGIMIADLPKTFREAVLVTRKLGFRYLWIDSLCIYQDSVDDWQAEAGHMSDIYGRAACCIAATASTDSDSGLFRYRTSYPPLVGCDSFPRPPFKISVERPKAPALEDMPPPGMYWCSIWWPDKYELIDDAPLNRRAWVAQERYLSTRVMHFTKDLLFWECLEVLSNEASGHGMPDIGSGLDDSEMNIFKMNFRNARHHQPALQFGPGISCTLPKASNLDFSLWYSFVQSYTLCSITKEDDYLVALSGITREIELMTGDRFVAGLWEQELPEGLCWIACSNQDGTLPVRSSRPTVWRAPTWSWASVTDSISTLSDQTDGMTSAVDILECLVDKHPSGQVISAEITLRCRVIPIELHWKVYTGWARWELVGDYDGNVIPTYSLFFDDLSFMATRTTEPFGAHLIILRDNGRELFHALLIVRSQRHEDAFERIGLLAYYRFDNNNAKTRELRKLLDEAEPETIKLV